MKTILKNILIWIGLSFLMMVFWIGGIMIGNVLIPNELIDAAGNQGDNGEIILLFTCMLNSGILFYFIKNSKITGWELALNLFIIAFGIQFFMSQIETLWFNDSVKFPLKGIFALVLGGAIGIGLFSIAATWLTGNFRNSNNTQNQLSNRSRYSIRNIVLLSAAIWPMVYWLAGYLIAWRFEAIRFYYTGSTFDESFIVMAKEYITSNLYFFQIFRGFLWVLIGIIILRSMDASPVKKAVITGLLLSILGSSQLLLPNPFMPEMVRMGHLLETSTSSFLWGLIIGLTLEFPSSQNPEKSRFSFIH